MRKLNSCFIVAATIHAWSIPVSAEPWGDLTVQFLFDGAAPEADEIAVTKDQAFCGKEKLFDESLVVDAETKGIANVIVYMYLRRSDKKPPIHESYAELKPVKVQLDNRKCRFEPHVVLVRTGQDFVIGNPDAVGHNTKVDTFVNPATNFNIPAGAELPAQQFEEPERLPAAASCSIHPWMKSWILIKDNPYFAVSDKEGKVEIKNIPAGKWTFQFYQEAIGYVADIQLNGKPTSWKRGRPELEIKPGLNDLGEVKFKLEPKKD